VQKYQASKKTYSTPCRDSHLFPT